MVYYYYDPHEDDAIINEDDKIGRQYVTESVYDFIKKLIVHIPQERVHTTRYYGFMLIILLWMLNINQNYLKWLK